MSTGSKVYLVGDKDANKNNSWLAMTNSLEEAERLIQEMPEAVNMKPITVKQGRKR